MGHSLEISLPDIAEASVQHVSASGENFQNHRPGYSGPVTPLPDIAEALHVTPKLFALLDLCASSLRRGHANILRVVEILTDDPRRECNIAEALVQRVGASGENSRTGDLGISGRRKRPRWGGKGFG